MGKKKKKLCYSVVSAETAEGITHLCSSPSSPERLKSWRGISCHIMLCGVGGNTRFFLDLTTTLNVAQRFPSVAEGANREIIFNPLVKEGTTGKL